MKRLLPVMAGLGLITTMAVAQNVVSFIHGTVRKVDKATKTIRITPFLPGSGRA